MFLDLKNYICGAIADVTKLTEQLLPDATLKSFVFATNRYRLRDSLRYWWIHLHTPGKLNYEHRKQMPVYGWFAEIYCGNRY